VLDKEAFNNRPTLLEEKHDNLKATPKKKDKRVKFM
jgi:hypothetical protein